MITRQPDKSHRPISQILVLGGGSAGLLAAITLKRGFPNCEVKCVRSKEIGVIGVGEGTTATFPWFLHTVLGLSREAFFARAQPTWKLGIRFLWGSRDEFNYTFATQLDRQWPDLPRPHGFYCLEDVTDLNLPSALMRRQKAFPYDSGGNLQVGAFLPAYHIENVKLVSYLEWQAVELGVELIEGTMSRAERNWDHISHVELRSGQRLTADLYIDASGFRNELVGKTFGEPFISFEDSLFCDKAVVAPRERRPDEPINPYTIAETYEGGWCWRIDHEHHVNRGYVYCSAFVSDEEAVAEFCRKNPGHAPHRVVHFRSGRYRRSWVGNVVAVGNAAGFVEPLEATALMLLSIQCRDLVQRLMGCNLMPTSDARDRHNELMGAHWDSTRDFLAIHYRYNTRLNTPFWRHCRATIPLHDLEKLINFYTQNGPELVRRETLLGANDLFGLDGYYALLVGMNVPYANVYNPSANEISQWNGHKREFIEAAERAASIREALDILRITHPDSKLAAG